MPTTKSTPAYLLALAATLSAALLLVAGCESEDDGNTAGTTDPAITLHITTAPSPPKVGQNKWTVMVHGKDGKMASGASVTVEPTMPSMGHGSSEKAVIKEISTGKFEAFPITLQMGGKWQVVVKATVGSETVTDTKDYDIK